MLRLAIFISQLILLVVILSLIFSNPFIISIDINDLKYSFASNIFIIFAIILIFLFYFSLIIFFRSRFSLKKYILKNKYKKIDKGYHHFMQAMIALANKDNKKASIFHKKMNKYLSNNNSLSLLVKSEVLKIEKKFPELTDTYQEMINSKNMVSLGYRGLMEQNLNNHDYHHAYIYGEKLFSIEPGIDKLYETLVYIIAKTKNWNQLVILSDKAYSKKIINKLTLNENKSIGLFEIAKIKYDGDPNEASKFLAKAIELRKDFPPYIKLHLEIISSMNNIPLLKKLIKKYWRSNPSSVLRKIIIKIINENKLDDLNLIKQIIYKNSELEESKKLLIYFAIQNNKWELARKNILGLIGSNPSKEICLFMAQIELGENDDKQKSDSWVLRSESSIIEDIWICKITQKTQNEWTALSDSGHFNSLVWSNPKMLLP